MLKKYVSRSQVNLNIRLGSGGSRHIRFAAKTGGGSVYYTSNESEQEGLERNAFFGQLYRLDSVEEKRPAPVVEAPAPTPKTSAAVEMRNNDDAKEYLAEKFGVSRSRMRSRAAIEEVAQANNVTIIWK